MTEFANLQLQYENYGLIGCDVPEEPVARYDYLNRHAILYTGRFLADGSHLEEAALSYSSRAKAEIPPQVADSLFRAPGVYCFGNMYVILRVSSWDKARNAENARTMVHALEWKFDIAPDSRTVEDLCYVVLGKADIYKDTKDGEDLSAAMKSCQEFLAAVGQARANSAHTTETLDCYSSVICCFSQLLYHEFRSSGDTSYWNLS